MTKEEWMMVSDVLCRITEDEEYLQLFDQHRPVKEDFDALWSSLPEKQQEAVFAYLFSYSRLVHRAIAVACQYNKK